MNDSIDVFSIFTPSRLPTLSYVRRQANYEEEVEYCIKTGLIAFIHGPSKSGKTVLARKVAENTNMPAYTVEARNAHSAEDFWDNVRQAMGLPDSVTQTRVSKKGQKKAVNWAAKIIAFFAEASAQGSIEENQGAELSESRLHNSDSVTELSRKRDRVLLVIDNFHHIQQQAVQREILQDLRNILEYASVIIIAITANKDYLTEIEPELIGRCQAISIANWSNQELMQIADRGFESLNVSLSAIVKQRLVSESLGAPLLIQAICLRLALKLRFTEPQLKRRMIGETDIKPHLNTACQQVSDTLPMGRKYDNLLETVEKSPDAKKQIIIRAQKRKNVLEDNLVYIPEAVLQVIVSTPSLSMTIPEIRVKFRNLTINVRQERHLLDIKKI